MADNTPIDTGEKTVTGRTIWRDPTTGQDYSERSTTFEIDGKYYTMPTVAEDGTQYTDRQIMDYVKEYGPSDYLTGEELPEFRYREDAIQYAISRSDTRKQKEEPMLQKQMLQFNEGGLSQEGGMVDEVSGNEVPMGSTREEVRDDIPAQVSEGEFIFPADVVRFIGLNQLMQMRQDAKMGLKQMDAMGQMGNSEEATMSDDMPFGMADLVVIDGPDEDVPSGMHKMPDGSLMEDSEMPQKKAKGGLAFANGGGIRMDDPAPSTQEVRTYVKEGSPDKRIPFFNGEPIIPIDSLLAEGYALKGSDPVAKTETEEAIPTRRISDRTPMKKTPFQEAGGWGMDFNTNGVVDPAKVKLWTDEYKKTSGRTPAVLTGIATVLAGPLGALVHMANKGNAKNAAANYERTVEAAKQSNVEGQVAALQSINKVIVDGAKKPEGEDEEDTNILDRAIDKFKSIFGFDDTQAEEIKKVSVKAGNTINQGPSGPKIRPQGIVDAANAAKEKIRELKEQANIESAIPLSVFGPDPKPITTTDADEPGQTTEQIDVDDTQTSSLPPEMQIKISQEEQLDDLFRRNITEFGGPGVNDRFEYLYARAQMEPNKVKQKEILDLAAKEKDKQYKDRLSQINVARAAIRNNNPDPAAFASIDITAPQTLKQVAAEIGVDFDFENVVANERNFEELFKQASEGTISAETILNDPNINPVQDTTSLAPVAYDPNDPSIPTAKKDGFSSIFSNIAGKIRDVYGSSSAASEDTDDASGSPDTNKKNFSQRLREKRKEEQQQKVSSARDRSDSIAARAKALKDSGIDLGGKTALQTVALQAEKNTARPPNAPDYFDDRNMKLGGLASRKKNKK